MQHLAEELAEGGTGMSDIVDDAQMATERHLLSALNRGVRFTMPNKPEKCKSCGESPRFTPEPGTKREVLACKCKRTSGQKSRQSLTTEWNYINKWR